MSKPIYDLKAAVANGAAWLDEHEPGWFHRVDLDELQMASCTSCILGQVDTISHNFREYVGRLFPGWLTYISVSWESKTDRDNLLSAYDDGCAFTGGHGFAPPSSDDYELPNEGQGVVNSEGDHTDDLGSWHDDTFWAMSAGPAWAAEVNARRAR